MSLLAAADEARLLAIARASVAHGLEYRRALALDVSGESPALRALGASFVTLRTAEAALRGCVGTLEAVRALAEDVAENAFRAAFHDPRFAPLGSGEIEGVELSIAILGEPEGLAALSADELAAQLRAGLDGLILCQGERRATFLPAVWASIPDAREFVRALERKAGIEDWKGNAPVEAFRYATTTIGERTQ